METFKKSNQMRQTNCFYLFLVKCFLMIMESSPLRESWDGTTNCFSLTQGCREEQELGGNWWCAANLRICVAAWVQENINLVEKSSRWSREMHWGSFLKSKAKHPGSPPGGRLRYSYKHPLLFPAAFSFSGWVNMLEGESAAVTADGVKTLTTFPRRRFMQSIHPITGDGLMLPCWKGQCLYLFLYFLRARLSLQA